MHHHADAPRTSSPRMLGLDDLRRTIGWEAEGILNAFWNKIDKLDEAGKRVQVAQTTLVLSRDDRKRLQVREDSARLLVDFVHERYKSRIEKEYEALARANAPDEEHEEGYRPF